MLQQQIDVVYEVVIFSYIYKNIYVSKECFVAESSLFTFLSDILQISGKVFKPYDIFLLHNFQLWTFFYFPL